MDSQCNEKCNTGEYQYKFHPDCPEHGHMAGKPGSPENPKVDRAEGADRGKFEQMLSAVLNVAGHGAGEKIVLNGQDISRFVRGVDISARPGELLHVALSLFLQERGVPHALEIPEQLASVVVVDEAETLLMRNVLAECGDVIRTLVTMTDQPLPDVIERIDALVGGPESEETLASYYRRRKPIHG